ncbi:MAG: 1-acyl-sn-glycerol-3-phosphate acyltransferase [Clostridia bacterium]|nr:1-acyl-sn-glycerol-3-phosphate acyltransferase [Clostridia bacterium]
MKKIKRFDFKKKPITPNFFWNWLVRLVAKVGLNMRPYEFEYHNCEGLKAPYVLLSNHASMVDFMVMETITRPYKVNNVASIEVFHDYSEFLFRRLGVIAKRKFTHDLNLIRNIRYSLDQGNVFCIYPEARYSLDGCTAYLPDSLGKMMKMLKVPVVVLNLKGNFVHCPQWNKIGKKNFIHADLIQVVTAEEIENLSADEINARIKEAFVYDDFAWQKANNIIIDHPKRANGLHSLLYQCPHCKTEYKMYSEGTELWCEECGKRWEMTELGEMKAKEGETEFSHIPDWVKWERANVREEVLNGTYHMEDEVRIDTMPNARGFIKQGNGYFTHDVNGMTLTGTAYGKPFTVKKDPLGQDSIHVEYDYKYGGDVFDIAEDDETYFFYPLNKRDILTKVAFAVEEIYFMHREKLIKEKGAK